jgi:hypothetical protein
MGNTKLSNGSKSLPSQNHHDVVGVQRMRWPLLSIVILEGIIDKGLQQTSQTIQCPAG